MATAKQDDTVFRMGVYGESFISDALSIQPNYYSQQGYEITNSSGTFTQKINYINLPLMLKRIRLKFFLEAGPQIGLAIVS
jgi:hypothetical protein